LKARINLGTNCLLFLYQTRSLNLYRKQRDTFQSIKRDLQYWRKSKTH